MGEYVKVVGGLDVGPLETAVPTFTRVVEYSSIHREVVSPSGRSTLLNEMGLPIDPYPEHDAPTAPRIVDVQLPGEDITITTDVAEGQQPKLAQSPEGLAIKATGVQVV
jgi:hypothetical protein